MMKKHESCLYLSGLVWLFAGCSLLMKGIQFLTSLSKNGNGEEWAMILVAIGLFIGYFKGRFILRKTVERLAKRILSMETPIPLNKVYPPKYFILLAFMIGLGVVMNVMDLRVDVRGVIDLAIGSALMHGAIAFFRIGMELKKATCDT